MRCLFSTAEVSRFLRAARGATSIEYAIIAAGIAGVLIATVNTLGSSVAVMWTSVAAIFN